MMITRKKKSKPFEEYELVNTGWIGYPVMIKCNGCGTELDEWDFRAHKDTCMQLHMKAVLHAKNK